MANPFLKRATEFYRDNEAFLAIVSPMPIEIFLSKEKDADYLFDRLVTIIGTPGSGKTTLARLFEYSTLSALLRHRGIETFRPIILALQECKAIEGDRANVLGCRLPLETDYRDFWEFNYSEDLKFGLMTSLIQARSVLAWIRNLTSVGFAVESINIVPRKDADGAVDAIGGTDGKSILEKARKVEGALYRIVSALVPPEVSDLEKDSISAYRPYDVIERFEVKADGPGRPISLSLKPLVILDDAHMLHAKQYRYLQHWLIKRELKVARWILTRFDVMHPSEIIESISREESVGHDLPGVTKARDVIEINLQHSLHGKKGGRRNQRLSFRKIAKDMSQRYLRKMPVFNQKSLHTLGDMLLTELVPLPESKLKKLSKSLELLRDEVKINSKSYNEICSNVKQYLTSHNNSEDIYVGMIKILLKRYAYRNRQNTLFDVEEQSESKVDLKIDRSVYDGARIHILHQYQKPYYYGIDDLCDASSENAEQFLRLAAILVDMIETRLIQAKPAALDGGKQHTLLRDEAEKIIRGWDFPECHLVKMMTKKMAEKCLEISLRPNAPLGAGANAIGIPQDEFLNIPKVDPKLARVLQFAIAYNAITVVPRYPCKNIEWCLLELGGMVVLKHGLTLKRGGFVESKVEELSQILQESRS